MMATESHRAQDDIVMRARTKAAAGVMRQKLKIDVSVARELAVDASDNISAAPGGRAASPLIDAGRDSFGPAVSPSPRGLRRICARRPITSSHRIGIAP